MSVKGSANSYIELRGKLSIPEAIQGKSAYEIALLNGFEGTEAEWLDSLTQETADKAEAIIKETKEAALNEVEAKGESVAAAINSEKNSAMEALETKEMEALDSISGEKSAALMDISAGADSALAVINAKVTQAANNATAAQTAATNAKTSENTAKTEANRATEAANNAESNVQNAIKEAKESGEFDGADGKSAYAFAQDGGYAGTESEFAKSLAGIPNWDEEDAYIANDSIVISEQTISSGLWSKRQMDIQLEIPYAVYINGTVYFCIAGEEDGGYYLGNPTLFYSASTQPHNNEPFCIYCAGGTATSGFFYKDDTLSYPLTLKVTRATVTTEKKLPNSYLPDDVALKSDIPEGGGGADIDVVAEVGQTIIVKEVDENGKPTKWESADFPEGVKVYTISEIKEMAFVDVCSELQDHPIFLYCDTDGLDAYVPLSYRTGSIEGIGFAGYVNAGFMVRIDQSLGDMTKTTVDLREITIPYFQGGASSGGVLKYNGSSWFVGAEQDISPGIIQVSADQLVDGASISVPHEQYVSALTQALNTGVLMLYITVDDTATYFPAVYISAPADGYPATVKIISPSTGGIITLVLIPA